MKDENFYIDKNGQKKIATVLTYFKINDQSYCIYTVPVSEGKSNVYCAKVVEGNLLSLESEEEKRLANQVVNELVKSLQKVNY